ncbi:MAG TPA: glycosyltransferase family 39 protein [Ktedonobacteraceae bacterium]|nr:glycosyltransferase family 39 protein [Ktedonobacteraceae bacterium]
MLGRRLDRYDLCAAAILTFGTLLRLVLIALSWPGSYNDEGTMGLMAFDVAYRGAHPLLYYGQDYMGSLEAYLGAGFFHLFGPSTFALRLGLVILFALFLLCMYLLISRLYSKSLALFSLLLLSLGAPDVIFRQLMAAAGPPDYLFFTTLLLLLTVWLAFSANRASQKPQENSSAITTKKSKRVPWPRVLAYGAWGGVAGVALWSHLLCLPFVLVAGFLLALFCRRELRLPSLSLLLLCFLIGLSPFLIYKATVPVSPNENTLFSSGGYREPSYSSLNGLSNTQATISPHGTPPRPVQQVMGTLLVAVPLMTNGNALCPIAEVNAWPISDQTNTNTLICTGIHGIWGIGYVLLLAIATLMATRRFWKHWRASLSDESASSLEQRQEAIRQGGRLMILTGAGLTLLAFMLYPQASAVTPWTSARYLIGLLIAIPAVLAPLWEKKYSAKALQGWSARLQAGARYGALLLVLVTCLLGTLTIFTQQISPAQVSFRREQTLIQSLLRIGATRVYMEYDDCNRITFLSNEEIICAALDKGLRPGLDRYFPYRAIVAQAPQPFYVLQEGSDQSLFFEQVATKEHILYQEFHSSGYTIYEPTQRITP